MSKAVFTLRFLLAVLHLDIGAFALSGFHSPLQPFAVVTSTRWVGDGLGLVEIVCGVALLEATLALYSASLLAFLIASTLVATILSLGTISPSAVTLLVLDGLMVFLSFRGRSGDMVRDSRPPRRVTPVGSTGH
jgi:hypothetical protein